MQPGQYPYGPPPPQAPQYAPPAPPQQQYPYAQPVTNQAPPQQNAQLPTFVQPAAPGGAAAPRPRDMQGALVAYMPRIHTPAGAPGNETGYNGGPARDRVTADLIVLETPGPIQFGGYPETDGTKQHTHTVAGPARFSGVWITNQTIVDALAPGGQVLAGQMVLGRIEQSQMGRKPFNLMAVDQATEARAAQIWMDLTAGRARYNDPTPLQAPAGSVAYGAPQQQHAPTTINTQFAPQPPAQAPQYAPQQPPMMGYGPNGQDHQHPVPQAAPAQPFDVTAPGWTDGQWATLGPAQRQQVWAAEQAKQAGAPVPNPY